MINAVWSFRNCNPKGIQPLDIILPLFSVIMWKRHHSNHNTKVYLDRDYFDKFMEYNILSYWSEFVLLDPIEEISLEHFWSMSKFEAISKEKDPFVLIDGDLIALCNFNEFKFFDYPVSVPLLEETSGTESYAYINPADAAEFGGLSREEFEWDEFADNMSLVFWNHKELKDKYIEYVAKYLANVIDKEIIHNPLGYLLFIEQKMFYEISKKMNIDKKYLIKDAYKLTDENPIRSITNGDIALEDSHHYVIHYGTAKEGLKDKVELRKHLVEYIIPLTGQFFESYFLEIYNKETNKK